MFITKQSKLVGEYIYMLGQFIKQLKSYGDFDLAQVVRTERLSILHNLDNPYRFSNFLESWESWGCPQTDDENFKYELIIFLIVQRPPIFYLPSHQILSNIIIAFLIFLVLLDWVSCI